MSVRIYTIGHSTRPIDEFLSCLTDAGIEILFDVRRYPSSRKFPQYNQASLSHSLARSGIEYRWLEALGGRRHGRSSATSPNKGLRSPGFRNYADYMLTAPFRKALEEVLKVAEEHRVALMCAEKLYFRCHRMLLSDALVAKGAEVVHIVEPGRHTHHRLSSAARVRSDGSLVYPEPDGLFPAG